MTTYNARHQRAFKVIAESCSKRARAHLAELRNLTLGSDEYNTVADKMHTALQQDSEYTALYIEQVTLRGAERRARKALEAK